MKHIPRKRFGQHFLVDEGVIDAIVRAIAPQRGDAMLEIGPGLGALTGPLAQRLDLLTVVELDRDLAARLRRDARLRVIEADVLKVDFSQLREDAAVAKSSQGDALPLRVVGNLPYNISTPVLFHLLRFATDVRDQHFMLQKEVVDRMVARPATSDYGRLSVMLQWRYAMESLMEVPPTAFEPPPRVHSAVVRMIPLTCAPRVDEAVLSEIVRVAFSQRRKLLRHTLGRWLEKQDFNGAFDIQRRAEEVPTDEYVALARALRAE